jgi:hypothetical protein
VKRRLSASSRERGRNGRESSGCFYNRASSARRSAGHRRRVEELHWNGAGRCTVTQSAVACRWPQAPQAQARPDLFKQHIDALYLASKELEGLAIVSKGNAERERAASRRKVPFSLSRGERLCGRSRRSTTRGAFGDALPSMRVIVYEAMNAASWGATAKSATSDGPQKAAMEQSNFHMDKSVEAMEQTRERLGKASRLYVTHDRDRSSVR